MTQDGHKTIECCGGLSSKLVCEIGVCDLYLSLLPLPSVPGRQTVWRTLGPLFPAPYSLVSSDVITLQCHCP